MNNINTNNSNYVVKELNIRKVNKNAVKYVIVAFIKSLDFVPKE